MYKNTSVQSLLILSLALFSGACATRAQTVIATEPASTKPAARLIGASRVGLSYNYTKMYEAPLYRASGYSLELNQLIRPGLDGKIDYEYTQASLGKDTGRQSLARGALVLFRSYPWGRPYIEAGVGKIWANSKRVSDSSFNYFAGAGVEIPISRAVSAAIGVSFSRYTGYKSTEYEPNLRGMWRLNEGWSATVGIRHTVIRHTKGATLFSFGLAAHY
ncbi:MAG: hypothetical protein HYV95_03620 [Opitutae bacterium]|nr:hypothetical protein [Opitutae bacterium]